MKSGRFKDIYNPDFPSVSIYIQNLHLTLSQAATPAFICLIFITIAIYEKTDPLISQNTAWAVCPRGPSQFISYDKGRQARACVATAPGAAGRFGWDSVSMNRIRLLSVLGVKIRVCLGCFTAANAIEFHPNCLPCQPQQFSVN